MEALLAFTRPALDWHALAPELTLLAFGTLITVVDIIWDDRSKQAMPTLAGMGLLATLLPILTLAVDGTERSMFGGAYVVDDFSLVLKALFLISGSILALHSALWGGLELNSNLTARHPGHPSVYPILAATAFTSCRIK